MPDNIKITSQSPRVQYQTDGRNTYEYPFEVFHTKNLVVYMDNEIQNPTTYTITTASNTSGGTVTFVTSPQSGRTITLMRQLDLERTTDFQEGGALRATALNHELDYQMACMQQVAEQAGRSILYPPSAPELANNLFLPLPSTGKSLIWNAAGTALENSDIEVNTLTRTMEEKMNTVLAQTVLATSAAQTATAEIDRAADKIIDVTQQVDLITSQLQISAEQISQATTGATTATAAAEAATQKAAIATAKATNAETAANTATTGATIASGKATEAGTSASNAAASAATAAGKTAEVLQMTNHITPVINETGNWVVAGINTAKPSRGIQGPVGPQGPQGIQGIAGPKGDKGDIGLTGAQGIQGIKGDMGTVGSAGPKGDTGPIGAQGIKGDTGITGPTGPQGVKGDTGNIGLTGPIGPQGPQGEYDLPIQTGNGGKYLKTDGTNPSWDVVDALPVQSAATVGQVLKSTADGAQWGESGGAGADVTLSNVTPCQPFKNNIMAMFAPDFTRGVSLAENVNYTTPCSGWMHMQGDSRYTQLRVDTLFPVTATITDFAGPSASISFVGAGSVINPVLRSIATFYPCKGTI